ncbi:MAG: acriflavine resistance protein B [Bacteroidia bacterium]|nr:MAG: acriflavine resistance protein B [Bacteroidia bacterium]
MINSIIQFSLNNRWFIIASTLLIIIIGIYQFQNLSIDAVPDITNNQVQIITVAPSFAAQDIERKVTFPIEQACSNIPGIEELRSFSRFGLSLITIVFNDNVDIYWARQQISERLQKVQNEISQQIGNPELAPITTGLGEIYQYVIRPENGFEHQYSLTDLREIQDWIVRRQLLGIPGVADVSSFGGKLKQFEIAINPYQLNAYQVSFDEILTALEKNNQNVGSAYIEKNKTAYFIRSEGIINTIKDIENIVIKNNASGIPIQIKDIANVRISYAPRYGSLVYTSQNGQYSYEVAGGIVMMLKGENSNRVIEKVKEKINQIQTTLPVGVKIEPFLDRTKMVNSTISTVFKNLLEGALIVIIVLILFLGNIYFGLVVASVIPLSMMFAVILMSILKVSGNLMSLGALDFGLIVDGSVIIVESVLFHLIHSSKHFGTLNKKSIVFYSASRISNAAVFGQIIILIVYIPILFFTGIEGKMFQPMAQVVLFALIGSFLLSITYVPVMCLWLSESLSVKHSNWSEKIMLMIEKYYLRLFNFLFKKSKIFVTTFILLFIFSIWLLINMGGEFMPTLEEGDFAVETRLITGTGLNTTIDYCQKASTLLTQSFPDEVEKVVSKIGSGEIPTDPMPIESADMMVILSPIEKWKKAKSFDELATKMQEKLSNIVGLSTSFQYPVQMRFNELIAGAKQDVVCKIFGENIDTLKKFAQIIQSKISTIKGTEGIYVEPIYGQPQLIIRFDREKLARYNISIEEANKVIQAIVAGIPAGQLYQNERKFDIIVRLDSTLKNMDEIKNILIPTQNQNWIPLNKLADIVIQTDINQIQRENAKRRIIVGFNVRGRDVESVINELKIKLKSIRLPASYFVEFGGSFQNLQSAKKRLSITVPIALLLIFIMLFTSFRSMKQSILVFSTIPMSIVGGIFFLYFRNMPFSISAGVGFIALFGIAVLNGIVLVSEFNHHKEKHYIILRIVISGITKRLRPVLMTATVASLGFLPMFLNTGIGANVQKPLATVVIGGIITSTLLTLFLLPILYYNFILKQKNSFRLSNKTFLIIMSIAMIPFAQSQTILSYQQCLDSALKNHPKIKMQNILSEYQKQLVNTSWNINKTQIQFQYGQYNGIYNDNAISVQQNVLFPTIYTQQKNILSTEWKISELRKTLEKYDVITNTKKLFYEIVILNENIKRLQKQDSIFTIIKNIIDLKATKGDISLMEKSSFDQLYYQNKIQLDFVNTEKKQLLLLLELLTGVSNILDVQYTDISINPPETTTTQQIETHPILQLSQQEQILQHQKIQLEKNKIFPDFIFGYTNQSLKGWGTDNIYYPISKRFQYSYIGLEIPIFLRHQTQKIKAEEKLLKYYTYKYELDKNNLIYEVRKLQQKYLDLKNIITRYKQELLPNARLLLEKATLNYQKGNINFIEWSMYVQQSIQQELDYLKYTQELNNCTILLNYYLTN